MRIDSVLQAPLVNPNPEAQEMKVIDEKQIKSILYLGIKGDVVIKPESDHSIDKYA